MYGTRSASAAPPRFGLSLTERSKCSEVGRVLAGAAAHKLFRSALWRTFFPASRPGSTCWTYCVPSVNGKRTQALNTRQKWRPCAAAGRATVRLAMLCARVARSTHDAEALARDVGASDLRSWMGSWNCCWGSADLSPVGAATRGRLPFSLAAAPC
eukprot:4630913-Prymnesium_polylepis.1